MLDVFHPPQGEQRLLGRAVHGVEAGPCVATVVEGEALACAVRNARLVQRLVPRLPAHPLEGFASASHKHELLVITVAELEHRERRRQADGDRRTVGTPGTRRPGALVVDDPAHDQRG